ncbi:MAG: hypothetical protein JW750_08170 [Anaerolineaceae bacterium]|nr:hypothetical protein [Anaerolineaceae bacterium]
MEQSKINLKSLEKQAYHQFFEDGLIEIMIGCVAILFACMILFDMAWLGAISGGLMLVLILAKKDLTAKRLGHANFISKHAREKSQLTFTLFLGGALFTAAVMLLMLGSSQFSPLSESAREWLRNNSLFIIAFLIAGCGILFAMYARIRRFFAYAPLIAAVPFIERYFEIHLGLPILTVGIIVFVIGVIMLIRFLRVYPVIETGAYDVENS